MVLTTGVGIRGGELGVTEGAYKGKNSAGNPDSDETLNADCVLCYELRCAEDSDADHQPDNESHGIEGREIWPRGHAVRLLRLGTARSGAVTLLRILEKEQCRGALGHIRVHAFSSSTCFRSPVHEPPWFR
jgi:hypothetical protein